MKKTTKVKALSCLLCNTVLRKGNLAHHMDCLIIRYRGVRGR